MSEDLYPVRQGRIDRTLMNKEQYAAAYDASLNDNEGFGLPRRENV